VAPPLFSKRSQSFNALVLFPNASPCNALLYISGVLKKGNLDYHKLKNLEVNDG
jgi:hypothetical protein